MQILRVGFPALCVYYGVLAVAHAVFLQGPVRTTMIGIAAGTAAVGGAMTLVRNRDFVRDYANAFAVLFALMVLTNSAVHLWLTGEVFQSTNLILAVLGAGVLLTSDVLFGVMLVLCWAAFGFALWLRPEEPLWVHFGFAQFAATILTTIVYLAQRAAHAGRFEAEQERDRIELARQQRAAEALAHESRYRVVVSLSPAAILVHRDGVVLFANKAAGRLIGAGDEEVLVDMRLYSLFPPDDEERVMAWYQSAVAGELGEDRLETRLRALGGEWPWVELATTNIVWEGEPAAILVATDITDRRELTELRDELVDAVDLDLYKSLEGVSAAIDDVELQRPLKRVLRSLAELRDRARASATED